ncbi:hypothetical protein IB279_02965 [Ensifer sp. ENS06]|uniref:hypothetical protein n=1 Tax=Ensifer sp. ENS06 TaxID=2769276 RepID=UPI001785886E|nr:hypothetical protein [Ensifer sp. ENS06]MBD9621899.1 hypothetical protein [Ensifer sp. ENS06]
MAEPANIVAFQEMVIRILGEIYTVHPKDIAWDPSSVFHDQEPDDATAELFDETVIYLVRNGYLDARDRNGFLALNAKSWAVLSKPDPLDPTQSIGSKLATWLKTTTSDGASQGAVALGQTALKAIGGAMGLPEW